MANGLYPKPYRFEDADDHLLRLFTNSLRVTLSAKARLSAEDDEQLVQLAVIHQHQADLVSGNCHAIQFRMSNTPTDARRVFHPDHILGGSMPERQVEPWPRSGDARIQDQFRSLHTQ